MDKKKSPSKKEARHLIESRIETSLADLKTVLGDKEFEERVKKAAKIFAKGFKGGAMAQDKPVTQKPAVPKEKIETPVAEQATPAPKAAAKKTAKKAVKKK